MPVSLLGLNNNHSSGWDSETLNNNLLHHSHLVTATNHQDNIQDNIQDHQDHHHQDNIQDHQDHHQDNILLHQDHHQDNIQDHQDHHQDNIQDHQDHHQDSILLHLDHRNFSRRQEVILLQGSLRQHPRCISNGKHHRDTFSNMHHTFQTVEAEKRGC
ncbi:hypothetical protein BDEG_20242 [Batrachochytrium dendrobatidis JEL423]|uniref:Uncharacterized protein n=1 Tax=Batrachochytrium dendrobatidis (strain JEL423) TaxID=403673 RepID=A0A177W7I9_BATDL|nr:hypothetical protein BDEG_20242 [Batrachochytrium dendrobatidis JEL423]